MINIANGKIHIEGTNNELTIEIAVLLTALSMALEEDNELAESVIKADIDFVLDFTKTVHKKAKEIL